MFGQRQSSAWFFNSSVHLEAVSRLLYLVENHEPLGIVTGRAGSGRTRTLTRLREELRGSPVLTTMINVSAMDDASLLWQSADYLCGNAGKSLHHPELLTAMQDQLTGRANCGVQTVILLDDFHRAAGDLSVSLRTFRALHARCRQMLTLILVTDRPLPDEFQFTASIPVVIEELDGHESQEFAQELIQRDLPAPSRVEASAVRAIALASAGNVSMLSKICAWVKVVQQASPERRINEETIYSLLTEFSPGASVATRPLMRAS